MGTLDRIDESDDPEAGPPKRADIKQWYAQTSRDLWSTPQDVRNGRDEDAPRDRPDLAASGTVLDTAPIGANGQDQVRPQTADLGPDVNDHGLSRAHREALEKYTAPTAAHRELNGALWGGTVTNIEQVAAFSHDLSDVLRTLPETHCTVYRGQDLAPAQLAHYEPGEIVVDNGYTSASSDPEREFGGAVLWVIESRHGRVIDELSECRWEREVLFDRFTRFEVLTNEYDKDLGRTIIYMREAE